MTLPVVELSGSPTEQGFEHGRLLKTRIDHNIEVYYERLEREALLSRDKSREMARLYLHAIRDQNQQYYDSIVAIAEGSQRSILDIAMLNVRYELLYYQFGVGGVNSAANPVEPDGCTAFALMPSETDNGHLWLGQNWDWIPEVQGAVLKTTEADGSRTMSFTEAGIAGGKIGVSSRGIGITINGMTTLDDDWSTLRKPVHVRCYEMLRAKSFEGAVNVIAGEPRACTTNFLMAGTPDQVADLEAGPEKLRRLSCENGRLVHTNNFLDPDSLGVVEAPNPRRKFSVGRCDRMNELLAETPKPVTIPALQEMLRDHLRWPYGICRHRAPQEPMQKHYITVTSVIMDLDSKTMLLTDGPPCEGEYQEVSL